MLKMQTCSAAPMQLENISTLASVNMIDEVVRSSLDSPTKNVKNLSHADMSMLPAQNDSTF